MVFFDKVIYRRLDLRAGAYFAAFTIALLFTSCGTTKYLDSDEYLLTQNRTEIRGKVENKRDLTYDLSTFYKQEPNSNFFFFFPREWYYFSTEGKEDKRFNRWLRRSLGEEPTIYSDSLTMETAKEMALYLQYKGYYNAKVLPQRDPRRQKMHVSYYAVPGERFYIDSVSFQCVDPVVDSILQAIKPSTNFQQGEPLDLRLLGQEKERITTYLRNHGYANFYSNYYGDLEIDTSQVPKHANLYLTILPPFEDSVHTQFYIGDVNVYTDYNPEGTNIVSDTSIANLQFFLSERGFIIKPNVFRKAISLRPGELYSQESFRRTNNQLSGLGIYRFVRIKQEVDSIQPNILHFNIQLTPNYKMELGADLELNFTNRSNSPGTGNLLGLSLSPSLRNRNLLRGAELMVTNLSAGVEIAPARIGSREFWNTVDLRAETALFFPQFLDYLNFWRFLYNIPVGKRKHLLHPTFYRTMREQADTRLAVGYNYLLILNWYRYDLLNVSYGFDFQRSNYTRYIIDHFAIDYLVPTTEKPFEDELARNPFLARSFGQQVFVSLLFREFQFIHSSRVNRRGQSFFIDANFEIAGSEVWAANTIYNEFSLNPVTFRLSDSINFSQYLRTEFDLRFYKQYTPDQSFAVRLNLGIARPFGFTTDVPYVKQFYVGGANSMRAWAPRGLGPGGYLDEDSLDPDNNFRLYQSGDLKLELNLEYRFKIFWRLKGALFIDAGNIWTFRRDLDRPGAQFLWQERRYMVEGEEFIHYPFYRQVAIGSGLGFRVDLSYFIFRFDVGVRLRNNYPRLPRENAPESAWWNNFEDFQLKDLGLNIGLGLPF